MSTTEMRGPIVATIAVVLRDERVLLVRRANPPDAGRWGLPGGKVEFGEDIETAAVRELLEETGVDGIPLSVFGAVTALDQDAVGTLVRHFVLVAVLCEWTGGEPEPGDDALEAGWFEQSKLDEGDLAMSMDVAEVVRKGAEVARRLSQAGEAPA